MRLYADCLEMHGEEKRNLHEMGVIVHPQTMQDKIVGDQADFRTLECSPAVFTIMDGGDRDAMLTSLGLNLAWARADFAERICTLDGRKHVNPGEAWKLRRETWEEFLHTDTAGFDRTPRFAYTYSERFGLNINTFYTTKPSEPLLVRLVRELREKPDTRQGILPVFNALVDSTNMGGVKRIPCSMHYQFMRRENKLKAMYVMRSCDFMTHFPYDIWMALELQHAIATHLDIDPGHFTFFAGSLHIYAKDADLGVF
jgi:hypothetical protein